MAFWDGSLTPVMRKWYWKECRIWWPFLRCDRSYKSLFLKKAYYGRCYRDWETDRKSTRLNSSHSRASRMPSSA